MLLFAIENRTAHLLVREPQAVPIVLSERAATERERAFLDALAQGRELPVHPTIQDLERYATEWADLVPEDPGTRAGVAHLLGTKYAFTDQAVPRLRSALGLDVDAVEQAYQRLYGTPLATIYAPRVRPADRLRWAASRLAGQLDALPTFWLAFVITLIIGAVNLALPIAVAGVGAVPGIVLIVVLGIINVVTVAAMVEVVTRSGSIRYGNAFIGTVVADYLGGASSAILTLVLTAFSFGILLIFYIGISTTLADATALPTAQGVPPTATPALPGGSVQTWPAPGNAGAPTYWPNTERVASFTAAGVQSDHIIAGSYRDGTGTGKLTYIGGHSFSTGLPYAGNDEAPYLRAFYNSLFFNGSAVAKIDLTYSPATYPQYGTTLLTREHRQHRRKRRDERAATSASRSRPASPTPGRRAAPTPSVAVDGRTLTWVGGLGDVPGGADRGDVHVAVDASALGHDRRQAVRAAPRHLRRRLRRGLHRRRLPRHHDLADAGADADEDAGSSRVRSRPARRSPGR